MSRVSSYQADRHDGHEKSRSSAMSSSSLTSASPPTSSASPPTSSASPPTSSPSPTWRFPYGNSTRYHHRERPRPHHARTASSYIPRAPVLSTEKRAHRRAQNSSLGNVPSPPWVEYSRSPLSRVSSATMRRTSHNYLYHGAPLTPAKLPRRNSSLQDSPFSDYFSDDARSSMQITTPSMETKALLLRMNKLQSQLMRDHSDTQHEAINLVARKLSEIEMELAALHTQPRPSIELDDSGVFMSEDRCAMPTPQHNRVCSYQSAVSSLESSEDGPTAAHYRAERDGLLCQLQEVQDHLNTANSELRLRLAEVREMNETHRAAIDERDERLEQLRSENEGLRQDLGFEYSELLFLKLQMKSLEVDVDELREDYGAGSSSDPAATERKKRAKKNHILSEMDRWRTDSDWQDVEARFKRRRNKYGILTSPVRETEHSAAGEIDWQLETVREEGRGRVTSLTIKRTDSCYGAVGQHERGEKESRTVVSVPLSGKTGSSDLTAKEYLEHGTQTMPTEGFSSIKYGRINREELMDDFKHGWTSTTSSESLDQTARADGSEDSKNASELEDREKLYNDAEGAEDTLVEKETLKSEIPHKSAWEELWKGLQNLAGLPGDDDDDDEEEEEERDD